MAGLPVPVVAPRDKDGKKEKILCIADLERLGSAKMSVTAREFYNSGSQDQDTLRANRNAYAKYALRPRVLRDVSKTTTATTIFGTHNVSMPLCAAPAGLQAMAHPDGELATSRACAKWAVGMGVSSYANHGVGEIVGAARDVTKSNNGKSIPHVMQMYSMKDRALQERTIRRAEEAGCVAIFLTADSPVLGVRYNEWKNDFLPPSGLAFPNLERTSELIQAMSHDDGFSSFNEDRHAWAREIPWLRTITKMQIWIKGVLTAEDVELAVEFGCDGVVVSNHGGRQLDGVPATLDVLPECAAAARGRIPLHVDGGVRSGTDIFKCLALGAQCCWVGRPILWSLSYDGQAGVETMLETYHTELKRCMQLCGCNTVAEISTAHLGLLRKDGPLARL